MIIIPHPIFQSSVITIHEGSVSTYNTGKDSNPDIHKLAKLAVLLKQVSPRPLIYGGVDDTWCIILHDKRQHTIYHFKGSELPTIDKIIDEPPVSSIRVVLANGNLSLEYDDNLIIESMVGWPHMDDRLKLLYDLAVFYDKSGLFVTGRLSIMHPPASFTITLCINGIDRQLLLEIPDDISIANSDNLKLSLINKISIMLNG